MRFALLTLAAALLAPAVRADIQFSNGPALTATTLDGSRFTSLSTAIRSVGFTIPADGPAYRLREVDLALRYVRNIAARVELWEGAAAPNTFVATLVTDQPPAGQQEFVYYPTTRIKLEPGSTYWVRVQASAEGSDFFWNTPGGSLAPLGTFDFAGYHSSSGSPGFRRNVVILRADAILLDNFNTTAAAGNTLVGQPSISRKAAGFTPDPGQDWLLRAATFTLSGAGAQAEVTLFSGLQPSLHRVTRLGSIINGQFDVTVRFADLLLPIRALERWWVELRPATSANLTWHGVIPNLAPSGKASSNGFLLNGRPNAIINRYEILASPLLGITCGPATGSLGAAATEEIFTELILPPGRTATLQSIGVRFSPISASHDLIIELWQGDAGPETLVRTFEEHDGIDTNLTMVFKARDDIALDSAERYWIRFDHEFSAAVLRAHDGRAQMQGILRVGPTIDDHRPDNTPLMFITGTGSIGCPADLSGSADPLDFAYDVPDGLIDTADFFYYLDQFDHGNQPVADLTATSDPSDPLYGFPDGAVDADDFFYYLDLFNAGCP